MASAKAPAAKSCNDWEPRDAEAPSDIWVQKGTEFVAWAHEQLLAAPDQIQYLSSRGLHLEQIAKYRLGFNPGAVSKGKLGPLFK